MIDGAQAGSSRAEEERNGGVGTWGQAAAG